MPEPLKPFTNDDVFEIVRSALRRADDNRINDVEVDTGELGQQLVITTDNGDVKQCFVIDAESIRETDCEQ